MQRMTLNCIGPFLQDVGALTQVCTICIHLYIYILILWFRVLWRNYIYIYILLWHDLKGWLLWQAREYRL